MDANEILTNEEVFEATGEVAEACCGKSFKVTAGIGLAVLAGGLAYKYIVKPMVAKLKAKKEQEKDDEEDFKVFECEEETEESEEETEE